MNVASARAPLRHVASARPRVKAAYILAMILAAAFVLRLPNLGTLPVWVDEAESCLNAFSILNHGYPSNTYLDLPVYENTLILPWKDSAEYEFRDSSYSTRNGLALYHGWLPLYAIAASFRVFGIHPDRLGARTPQHDLAERRFRTEVARLPGVLFGVLSILGLYLAGARLYNRQAGFLAAFIASLLTTDIYFSQQARYYGATLAGCAFAAWSIERMSRESRWRDYVWGGIIFSLLFYTHLISFAIVCAVWAFSEAFYTRHSAAAFQKRAVFLAIIAALCTPWIIATDLIHQISGIPSAWNLMKFPRDLIITRAFESEFGVAMFIGLVLLSLSTVFSRWRPAQRVSASFHDHVSSYVLLYLWLGVGYFAFIFLTPAASFWLARFALTLLVPVILLIAMTLCSLGRLIDPRHPFRAALAGALLFIAASDLARPLASKQTAAEKEQDVDAVVDYLARANVKPDTVIFATPNEQLVLTFYTGMPIQSIAPIRKTFLDDYAGDLILFEKADLSPTGAIQPKALREAAAAAGQPLGQVQAESLSREIASLDYRTKLSRQVARVVPPPAPVPRFAEAAARQYRLERSLREEVMDRHAHWGPPFFKHASIRTIFDWWNQFFYAFVNPAWREAHPNYRDRFRNASAITLPSSNWSVLYSPGPAKTPRANTAGEAE